MLQYIQIDNQNEISEMLWQFSTNYFPSYIKLLTSIAWGYLL